MTASTLVLLAAIATVFITSPASAFVSYPNNHACVQTLLSMSKDNEVITSTRRGFIDHVSTTAAAIAGATSVWMQPTPALAYGLSKANDKLAR